MDAWTDWMDEQVSVGLSCVLSGFCSLPGRCVAWKSVWREIESLLENVLQPSFVKQHLETHEKFSRIKGEVYPKRL